MGARKYRDIEVRGVVYPTAQAAAAALGVREITVLRAARLGRLDTLGLGAAGLQSMPVRIRGVVYPSAAAAASALGVGVSAVRQALARGREDRVGLPRHRKLPPNSAPGKAVSIGGFEFVSQVAADAALGLPRGTTSRVRRGVASRERWLRAAMQWSDRQRRAAA